MLIGHIKDYANEVSDENEDSTRNWSRGHSFYVLAKNLSTFCPCPETFGESEFESDDPINLVEEISRQHRIQAVVWVLPLLLVRFIVENQEQKAE
jgi:hypothetical protein